METLLLISIVRHSQKERLDVNFVKRFDGKASDIPICHIYSKAITNTVKQRRPFIFIDQMRKTGV